MRRRPASGATRRAWACHVGTHAPPRCPSARPGAPHQQQRKAHVVLQPCGYGGGLPGAPGARRARVPTSAKVPAHGWPASRHQQQQGQLPEQGGRQQPGGSPVQPAHQRSHPTCPCRTGPGTGGPTRRTVRIMDGERGSSVNGAQPRRQQVDAALKRIHGLATRACSMSWSRLKMRRGMRKRCNNRRNLGVEMGTTPLGRHQMPRDAVQLPAVKPHHVIRTPAAPGMFVGEAGA